MAKNNNEAIKMIDCVHYVAQIILNEIPTEKLKELHKSFILGCIAIQKKQYKSAYKLFLEAESSGMATKIKIIIDYEEKRQAKLNKAMTHL